MSRRFLKQIARLRTMLSHPYNESDAVRLIYSYRYASLLITSLFYLVDGPARLIPYKLAVVLSLSVAARLFTDLYVTSHGLNKLRATILLETAIITLLLIPTGGLSSPFIWYALNPVLVAAWYLSPYFCWATLLFYTISAAVISARIFNKGNTLHLFLQHSYLILVFILITLLVQLLATLLKKLQHAIVKQNEALAQIMDLYQVIETFSTVADLERLYQTFTAYAAQLTKAPVSFYWHLGNENSGSMLYTNVSLTAELTEQLRLYLTKHSQIDEVGHSQTIKVSTAKQTHTFYARSIASQSQFHGLLGIEIMGGKSQIEGSANQQLGFLADLSSIIIERLQLEETNDTLILLEERNRIANEIHDSVSQRLFSINCALHVLRSNWHQDSKDDIDAQLKIISDTSATAMRELRQSIYALSTKKSDKKFFFSSISNYLDDLAKLNGISISLKLTGEEELISARLKRSLLRIISEATGNAVKHGQASHINIELDIGTSQINLTIHDQGRGFLPENLTPDKAGLGLSNMRNLVQTFGGQFKLSSQIDCGVRIEVSIPILPRHNQGGVA